MTVAERFAEEIACSVMGRGARGNAKIAEDGTGFGAELVLGIVPEQAVAGTKKQMPEKASSVA